MWYSFIYSPTFWFVLFAIALLAPGILKSTRLSRLPIFGNRKTLMVIAVVGFLVTSGIFGSFGSWGTASMAGAGVTITDLQVTTNFLTDAGGTTAENTNTDDLWDVRTTDAQANETTDVYEVDTGVITLTRSGNLEPMSCPVRCIMPPRYENEAGNDGNDYNILEIKADGTYECYLNDGSAATTSSPRMETQIAFAEGDAVEELGVALEVDEEGHDALEQYSYKDVIIDVCGKPYTFRIHRMD